MEPDRRDPTKSVFRIDPDPKQVRETLDSVRQELQAQDSVVSRKVVQLVGIVIDEWLRYRVSARGPLELEIASMRHAIRVEATVSDWKHEPEFWKRVGNAASVGLADRWGVDRRKDFRGWFEIDT